MVALLLSVALFPVYPGVQPLRAGTIVARAILAPRDLSYESEVRTSAVRKQAADAIPEVVVLDTTVRDRQIADLEATSKDYEATIKAQTAKLDAMDQETASLKSELDDKEKRISDLSREVQKLRDDKSSEKFNGIKHVF